MSEARIVISLVQSDDESTLTVDVEGELDFLTVLGLMEAAKNQYIQSKYLGPAEEASGGRD